MRFDKISDEMCRDVVKGDEMWVDLMHIKNIRLDEMFGDVMRSGEM